MRIKIIQEIGNIENSTVSGVNVAKVIIIRPLLMTGRGVEKLTKILGYNGDYTLVMQTESKKSINQS